MTANLTRATWGARCGKSARRVLRGGTGTSGLTARLVPTHHYFVGVYNVRQREYAAYAQDSHHQRDKSVKNTLLWEYGKRMLGIISNEKSAVRILLIGNIAMQYISDLMPLVRQVAEEFSM